MKPQSEKFLIKFLYYKLKIDKCNWDVKLIVTNWHVPFIRAIYKPDNISVDISFQNGLAVETANLMHHLFDIQPEAAKLCLLMKKWLKIHKVVVKNYSLVLLVVFFLQQYNYLPSIKTVQKNSSFSTVIQGFIYFIYLFYFGYFKSFIIRIRMSL